MTGWPAGAAAGRFSRRWFLLPPTHCLSARIFFFRAFFSSCPDRESGLFSTRAWSVSALKKVKLEAAAQRRPARSERKNRSSPVRQFSAFTAARQGQPFRPLPLMQRCRGREGDPGRPQGGRSAAAGADITRQSREGPRRCPMRHAADRVQPDSRDKFRVPAQRGVRGCRGCRGDFSPLTPCPAPGRRPAARAGQQPRYTEGHRLKTTRVFYLFQS